ncbi:PREDICTED: uncharacterized protein LOC104699380 [Camelina sativa]|uniref:Uncharacterized protein LOC104699380 n=1 Tax=Camelina sativa TaxID=90675 RepID=A0ABM0SLI2_CAMSA|nr:PREDICTED: uncharacterized protein LOC104699380 [Camelina sativa]
MKPSKREESKTMNILESFPMKNKRPTTTRNTQNQVPSKEVMSEPSSHNLHSSSLSDVAAETADNIRNEIEECISKYMSFEETVTYIRDNHQIPLYITTAIWEGLQERSPEFFKRYYLNLEVLRQIKMCNSFLRKQAILMLGDGQFDITTAPPAVMNFLDQILLEELANTPSDMSSEMSPSSFAMLALGDTNGPTGNNLGTPTFAPPTTDQWLTSNVNQLQTPNCQQNQWSTPYDLPCNLGAHPIVPAASNQCPISNHLSYYYPAFSTVAPEAPSVAQPPAVLCGMSTFGFGENIENGGSYFKLIDPSLAKMLTQPEYPLQDPYGQHQPPYLQQNFSVEELLPYGVTNNELPYGGNNNELQYGVTNNELPYGGNNNELQYGVTNNELPYGRNNNELQYGVTNNELPYGGNNNELQYGVTNNELPYGRNNNELQYGVTNNELPYGGNNNELQYGVTNNELPYGRNNNELQYGVTNNELPYGGNNNELQYGVTNNELPYGRNNNELQYGVTNNELQYGGNNKELQYGVTNNELQYGGNNKELQYGGNKSNNNELQAVIPQQQQQHHQEKKTMEKAERQNLIPESNDSNNSNSGDSTVTRTQNQHDPSKATANTRYLKENRRATSKK